MTRRCCVDIGVDPFVRRPWYLNYASYPYDWKPYYRVEPTDFAGSAAQQELVMGGEAWCVVVAVEVTRREHTAVEVLVSAIALRGVGRSESRRHLQHLSCRASSPERKAELI